MKPLIPDFFPLQTGATHSIPPEENLGTVGAPVFLHNDPEKDIKVLNALQDELQTVANLRFPLPLLPIAASPLFF